MSRYRARLSQTEEIRGTLQGSIYRGYSAYQIAVQHGYEGTEEEWLESLKGFSPSASVEQTDNGATVTVTDESGETSAEIRNGTDGHSPKITAERTGSKETTVYSDGQRIALILDGIDGVDGTTPTASVEKSGTTATITITDKAGTTTATVTDGTDGYTPVRGTDYWTQADQTAIVNDVLESQAISDIQDDLSDVKNDLSQKYEKPSTGIPASDIESGVIPDVSGKADKVQSATSGNFASLDANGNLTDSGHKHSDYLTGHQDLTDYVKNTDYADGNTGGVVKVNGNGLQMFSGGVIGTNAATSAHIKGGTASLSPVTPIRQHESVFYGLAKAAGDTTQASSSNAVGNYTETAQSKIHEMLDAPVTVSGTTPTITGKAGIRYICGEVSTLSITPPASGIIDVIFTSGSTPTVLTVPSTVKFPEWFDPTSLVANTTYEINIADGVYGAVMTWT